jgi:hypothetical protein
LLDTKMVFLKCLGMESFVYFMSIWHILWLIGIFCGHLVHLVVIWFI